MDRTGHDMQGTKVLRITDDPSRAMTEALPQLGYVVRTASSGSSGLASFEAEAVDLVLLDARLRDMDAIDVCKELKVLSGDAFLPVIFLTTEVDVTERVRALEVADDICFEPLRLDELDARIRLLLRSRDRERRVRTASGKFHALAFQDLLTDLGNRRALERDLGHAWAQVSRSRSPLALLMIDIDRFKSFNDEHGHRSGDEVLRTVAQATAGAIRKGDRAYRQGGEEFVVLAPDAGADGALVIAERVRRAVAATRVAPVPGGPARKSLNVTVSIGFAIAPSPGLTSSSALLEAADRALYDAKAAGRDRVVASAPSRG